MIYSLTSRQSATAVLPCQRAHTHTHTCKLSIATYTQIHAQLTIIILLLTKIKIIKLQHYTKQTTNTLLQQEAIQQAKEAIQQSKKSIKSMQ